jgi:hypothetical protein
VLRIWSTSPCSNYLHAAEPRRSCRLSFVSRHNLFRRPVTFNLGFAPAPHTGRLAERGRPPRYVYTISDKIASSAQRGTGTPVATRFGRSHLATASAHLVQIPDPPSYVYITKRFSPAPSTIRSLSLRRPSQTVRFSAHNQSQQ